MNLHLPRLQSLHHENPTKRISLIRLAWPDIEKALAGRACSTLLICAIILVWEGHQRVPVECCGCQQGWVMSPNFSARQKRRRLVMRRQRVFLSSVALATVALFLGLSASLLPNAADTGLTDLMSALTYCGPISGSSSVPP